MKTLIVFSANFPYLPGEEFMESEYKYWAAFDRIIIVPDPGGSNAERRNLDGISAEVIRTDSKHFGGGEKLKGAIWTAFRKEFWQDLPHCLCKSIRGTYLRVRKLVSLMAGVHIRYLTLKDLIRDLEIDFSDCVCYAYWLAMPSYLALMLKEDHPAIKVVSRCHRGDLYEYAHNGYLPIRMHLIRSLDVLYCISDDGERYVREHYGIEKKLVKISRLGTVQPETPRFPRRDGIFKIVSCSYMVPVKRVDRIIRALSLISNHTIAWVHFGGGEMFDELQELAERTFGKSGISYQFPGHLPNKYVLDYYRENDVNLFINVSESEGVPVSIMEATSFGIPVIATEVGGTPEVVEPSRNGFLLNKDFSDEELRDAIVRMIEMDEKDYADYQRNARALWEERYMADKNYPNFVKELLDL